MKTYLKFFIRTASLLIFLTLTLGLHAEDYSSEVTNLYQDLETVADFYRTNCIPIRLAPATVMMPVPTYQPPLDYEKIQRDMEQLKMRLVSKSRFFPYARGASKILVKGALFLHVRKMNFMARVMAFVKADDDMQVSDKAFSKLYAQVRSKVSDGEELRDYLFWLSHFGHLEDYPTAAELKVRMSAKGRYGIEYFRQHGLTRQDIADAVAADIAEGLPEVESGNCAVCFEDYGSELKGYTFVECTHHCCIKCLVKYKAAKENRCHHCRLPIFCKEKFSL